LGRRVVADGGRGRKAQGDCAGRAGIRGGSGLEHIGAGQNTPGCSGCAGRICNSHRAHA